MHIEHNVASYVGFRFARRGRRVVSAREARGTRPRPVAVARGARSRRGRERDRCDCVGVRRVRLPRGPRRLVNRKEPLFVCILQLLLPQAHGPIAYTYIWVMMMTFLKFKTSARLYCTYYTKGPVPETQAQRQRHRKRNAIPMFQMHAHRYHPKPKPQK